MPGVERKWERLSPEERQRLVQELIDYFERERDEKIGLIAAGDLLDHFLRSAGTVLYNKGIHDARKAMESRFNELNYDLDELTDT